MNTLRLIYVGLLIGLCTSCEKEDLADNNQTDYLIFGHFYGMCAGEQCVETFKLTNQSLFEDTIDDYAGQHLSFVQLEDDKFQAVKELTDLFPMELLNETNSVLGCPDCADGGGLVVQRMSNGSLRSWRIDQVKDNVPGYLHSFMDRVNEKIALINK